MHGDVRIGISGWTYAPWRGKFFPKGVRQKDELAYASQQFRTIEINGTFYGTQRPTSFEKWRTTTPDDFVFSVKAPRFITHTRRLRDVKAPLANFLGSGLLKLAQKLGPILWQFPPSLKFDPDLFEQFFAMLPHDTPSAAKLAKHHDAQLRDGWFETDHDRPLRHAVEIRNESFRDENFITLLRRYNIALVCADTVEWPRLMDITSDFIYCRLHGSEQLYASGYDEKSLHQWSTRVKAWSTGHEPQDAERIGKPAPSQKSGRDVFVYFDNDMKVRAPVDAKRLEELVKSK